MWPTRVAMALDGLPMSLAANSHSLPETTLSPPGLPLRMRPTGSVTNAVSGSLVMVTVETVLRDRSPVVSMTSSAVLDEVSVPGPL